VSPTKGAHLVQEQDQGPLEPSVPATQSFPKQTAGGLSGNDLPGNLRQEPIGRIFICTGDQGVQDNPHACFQVPPHRLGRLQVYIQSV